MTHFNSRDLAAIALCSALWGVLNAIFSPIFFSMFGLPFLCDIIGFSVLIVASWWIRKIGAITLIGVIATIINFIFNPGQIFFVGFTVASVVFDVSSRGIGYERSFRNSFNSVAVMMPLSIGAAAIAGFIIGSFFMPGPALIGWGGVLGWAGLHAFGGVIGGVIGVSLVLLLRSRGILNSKFSG
jgi:hypothetical protein